MPRAGTGRGTIGQVGHQRRCPFGGQGEVAAKLSRLFVAANEHQPVAGFGSAATRVGQGTGRHLHRDCHRRRHEDHEATHQGLPGDERQHRHDPGGRHRNTKRHRERFAPFDGHLGQPHAIGRHSQDQGIENPEHEVPRREHVVGGRGDPGCVRLLHGNDDDHREHEGEEPGQRLHDRPAYATDDDPIARLARTTARYVFRDAFPMMVASSRAFRLKAGAARDREAEEVSHRAQRHPSRWGRLEHTQRSATLQR
jgi:hypothetical protein